MLSNSLRILFIHKLKKFDKKNSMVSSLDNSSMNSGYGFFFQSIKTLGKVEFAFGYLDAINKIKNQQFDLIILDLKTLLTNDKGFGLIKILQNNKAKKILFCAFDGNFTKFFNVNELCKIVDFDSIFVTNLFKDKGRYLLENINLDKLYPTYQGMGSLGVSFNHKKNKFNFLNSFSPHLDKKYDAFFIGLSNELKPLRQKFLKEIPLHDRYSDYNIYLNSYDKNQGGLCKDDYIKMIKSSIVSIDLSGTSDNLTMRFNEILFCNEMVLTDSGILHYYVSEFFLKQIDKFVFKNHNDFFDLLDFYKKNDDYRLENIKNIRKIFLSFYNPYTHGKEIYKTII